MRFKIEENLRVLGDNGYDDCSLLFDVYFKNVLKRVFILRCFF